MDKRQNDCPFQLEVNGEWFCGKITDANVVCPDTIDFRACGDYPYKKRRKMVEEILAAKPLKVVKCKSCGADITWIETQNGRSMPCNFPAVKYQANRKGKSQIVTVTGRVIRADVITDDDKQTPEAVKMQYIIKPKNNKFEIGFFQLSTVTHRAGDGSCYPKDIYEYDFTVVDKADMLDAAILTAKRLNDTLFPCNPDAAKCNTETPPPPQPQETKKD